MKQTSIRGALYILLSALFFGSYGIWSRLMAGSYGDFTQAWIRGAIILVFFIPFALWKKNLKPIESSDWKWFAIIALCGGFNQAPYYFGFAHLSIGTATLLFYTMLTIGAYIIGMFFFKEKITIVKYVSLFLAIAGLYTIYSLTISNSQIWPAALTALAGLMGAAEVVLSKKISDRYSKMQILISIFAVTIVANGAISLVLHDSIPSFNNQTAWFAQLGYTASMILAMTCVFYGFQFIEDPSIGGLIGLMEIVFAVIFGFILFSESITISFVIGTALIVLAMALPDLWRLIHQ